MHFKKLFVSGAIVPMVVLTCIGVAVLGTLGSMVRNGVANHGLMPQPPVAVVYDDLKDLRVLDTHGAVQTCSRTCN